MKTQISNTDVNSVITVCQQKYPFTRTGLKVKSYAIMPRSMIFYTLYIRNSFLENKEKYIRRNFAE